VPLGPSTTQPGGQFFVSLGGQFRMSFDKADKFRAVMRELKRRGVPRSLLSAIRKDIDAWARARLIVSIPNSVSGARIGRRSAPIPRRRRRRCLLSRLRRAGRGDPPGDPFAQTRTAPGDEAGAGFSIWTDDADCRVTPACNNAPGTPVGALGACGVLVMRRSRPNCKDVAAWLAA
jgi:hypothetical protein